MLAVRTMPGVHPRNELCFSLSSFVVEDLQGTVENVKLLHHKESGMRGLMMVASMMSLMACGADESAPAPKEAKSTAAVEKTPPAQNCTYTLAEATPGWTAYKTTDKAPVSGTFTATTLSPTQAGPSLAAALDGVSMTIDPASVSSGNEGRDKTLQDKYFGLFAPQAEFTVGVVSVKGDDAGGTVDLNIGMNGVSKTLVFPYQVSPDGTLTAKASLEMLDFGLQAAFDSIHKVCEVLHTGADGVSKTWTDVELSVTAKVTKDCS